MRRPLAPRLDDRSFDQLRAEAIERIKAVCPEWTDFSASDPGIALVEVFAYLTQTLLYRVNRVPDKQYRAFLGLLGMTALPPAAATVRLTFTRTDPKEALEIPRGASVLGESVVFSTAEPVRFAAGVAVAECSAFHGEQIEGELLGESTGAPGLEYRVKRPPIVAPMDDHLDLMVAVEETEPLPPEAAAVKFDRKTFRVWREVASFAEMRPGERAYLVDRQAGLIRFPPAIKVEDRRGVLTPASEPLGAIPPQGRQIRVSYRTGGGVAGNVRAGVLVNLKEKIPGVTVTNPAAATGGRDAEPLDNLLVRGPTDFHRLDRAVTARDYEILARRIGGIARAKAFTKSEVWRHASPGVVEVLLVPTVAGSGPPSLERLRAGESAAELGKVRDALGAARPLASDSEERWTKYKPVTVSLTAVVSRQEDSVAVKSRILQRLERLITPLPRSAWDDGWTHGRSLRRYDIEGTVRAEPGVLYVSDVELTPDQAPTGEAVSVVVDAHQPRTWFAGFAKEVYRTMNGGDGWELVKEFPAAPGEPEEQVLLVRTSSLHTGLVVVLVQVGVDTTKAYLSHDCGESFESVFVLQNTRARDAAWSVRDGVPLLFVATDDGLFEFLAETTPLLVEVDSAKANRGISAVRVHTDVRGITYVAAATNDGSGVFLSRTGGDSKSFVPLGLPQNVIELAVQSDGVRSFLWAGFGQPDLGTARYELLPEAAKEGWLDFVAGWGEAGSCLTLDFLRDGRVVAGSHSRGVLWLDPKLGAQWQTPSIDCGLPIRDETVEGEKRLLHPVTSLAVERNGSNPELDRIVAGTARGVYRGEVPEGSYQAVTDQTKLSSKLREVITLPPTWLFCSGRHRVTVVTEDDVMASDQ